MIACPECGKLVTFNTYFGAYICRHCNWKNDDYNIDRASACSSGTNSLPKTLYEYSQQASERLCEVKKE